MADDGGLEAVPEQLLFYATPEHECSYLPGRRAVTVFADPAFPKSPALYTLLARHGLRRSGEHLYVPRCPACTACVPVRVPVREFRPGRRHRRVLKINRDLQVRVCEAGFDPRHYRMYCRYQSARHPGGGMDSPTPEQYMDFLACDWGDVQFLEFSEGDTPLAVAVMDCLGDGLSAVYTFFEPAASRRGLGVNAVLSGIAEAARRGLDWLYLGYWVSGCQKMDYKREYLPQERLLNGDWQRVD